MRVLAALFSVVLASACRPQSREGVSSSAAATDASFASLQPDGQQRVAYLCGGCHGEDILAQQRLTAAQWTKVVKKMAGWGALITPDDEPVVSAYLAAKYRPDAGPYVAPMIDAATVRAQLDIRDDGQFAHGDIERGRIQFMQFCAACHGVSGRGGIGINLVDRPLLGRATEIAVTVYTGRGIMPALQSANDARIADLIAYLRTLP